MLVTTNNYNTFTNLHTLQRTTADSKSSVFTSHCLVATSNSAVSLPWFLCSYMFIHCHGNVFVMLLNGNSFPVLVPLFHPAAIISQYNSVGQQVVHEGAEHTINYLYSYLFYENLWLNVGLKNIVFRYHICLMQIM
jgi:hypothetical protein